MGKTISSGMRTHIGQQTTTLALCWRVKRQDGQEFYFTNSDKDIEYQDAVLGDTAARTYKARTGFTASAIKNSSDYSVNNLEVNSIFDSADISETDLRAGLFDGAEVRIFAVNYNDLTLGDVKLLRGSLGEVLVTDKGFFSTELRDLLQLASQNLGELYSPECRADLGDDRCKVPINPPVLGRTQAVTVGQFYRVPTLSPLGNNSFDYENRIYRVVTAGTTAGVQPTYDKTVGQNTTDGTAVLQAEESWTRSIIVSEVTNERIFKVTQLSPVSGGPRGGFPNNWFKFGAVTWETGNNAGTSMEVKSFTADPSSQTIELFLPLRFPVVVGHIANIYPGCGKRFTEFCVNKFANAVNFRGEPHLPGSDYLATYPDAKT